MTARVCLMASLIACLLLMRPGKVAAHDDPSGCTTTGLSFGVAVFRADGVTPIRANDPISPCETIQYQFSIQYRAGTNDCGFRAAA